MEKVLKIGILGAMREEVLSIIELMAIAKTTIIAGREYFEGTIGDQNVVVVFSRWGKVAAASTTTTLINLFDVDFVLFTGVAGAVSESLNIGDIVIGSGLYQHDMDARPFFKQFQIPLTNTLIFKPRPDDVNKAKYASERFVANIGSIFPQDLMTKYTISKPRVLTGLIASGDQFISNPTNHFTLNFIGQNLVTLAVEMEGASVAQVCEDFEIPYSIIRIISDKADHSAVIDFQSFISGIASIYSAEIIKEYCRSNC